MSSDYHRPTHTFQSNAYNATQVRLYGIPGKGKLAYFSNPATFSHGDLTVSIAPSEPVTEEDLEKSKKHLAKLERLSVEELDPLWPLPTPIPVNLIHHIALSTNLLGVVNLATSVGLFEDSKLSAGVIFGYAYEGHCYDLAKPKIMFIPAIPTTIPADDCGFDAKQPANYRVWVVDKLDHCAEIELNQGFVEQIVLDSNLPGKRSPRSYSAVMQLAHRSGRLSE